MSTILIVEDDPIHRGNAEAFKMLFNLHSHSVILAHSPEDVLNACRWNDVDCVMVDQHIVGGGMGFSMRIYKGEDIIKSIRASGLTNVPVILMTGDREYDPREARKVGANHVWFKPIEDMISKTEEVMREARLRAASSKPTAP
ncbi:MAG TPA: response regulator [Alphaproteobacteria bacterium]|nr:response regulator [Alphaproteobacteria bacterium]HNS43644.1 response regulator [Alphaproteobacteria bacterium]